MGLLSRVLRFVSLVVLAVGGTITLMHAAPGYFSDLREMDSSHASLVRSDLDGMRAKQGSLSSLLGSEVHTLLRGDLGKSRQYEVPVTSLIKERVRLSGELLVTGVFGGWSLALFFALPLSMTRRPLMTVAIALVSTPLLAVPVGVLATVCMVANLGGPASVLAIIIGLRDFRLLYRLLKEAWEAPHVLYARAQGFSAYRIARTHLAPSLKREVLSMLVLSFTLALSALVPVEVIFDRPGLGQLAWSAAMNRDLPVLVAVTIIMAACIGVAGAFAEPAKAVETSQCA